MCPIRPSIRRLNPVLSPYDLTRGGSPFFFPGHADIKEVALYVQDTGTGRLIGIRGDLYH
jgi:hypothetical protein